MSLAERTLDFAAKAPDVQTRKALGAELLSVLQEVGASRYACIYLHRRDGELVIGPSITNLPPRWLELYMQRGYDAADPVFQGVVRGGAYGYWSELTRGMVLDRRSREVMGQARDFDMREGFTKRVMLPGGGIAVVMAAGDEMTRDPHARAALRMSFHVFANEGARMLNTAINGRVPGRREEPPVNLSRTQLKVLLMRADGLSNKQVAMAMGRHEKTIECHVTEVLRRLDARNMIDAIRIATKLKLMI